MHMQRHEMRDVGTKRPLFVAVAVAVVGLSLTVTLFGFARKALLESFQSKFEADVSIRARLVQDKLQEALLIGRAVQRFIATSGEITRQSFNAFTLPFVNDQSGLRSIDWVPAVPRDGRALFESEGRTKFRSDFQVFEYDADRRRVPAGDRNRYYPILFVEPQVAENLSTTGFDMGSTPDRLAAMERARDSGEPAVTELLSLAGVDAAPGFTVFLPVYAKGEPVSRLAERRASVRGYVLAVFRTDVLIQAALKPTKPIGLPFDLLDISASPDKRVLYHWTARLQEDKSLESFLISPPPPVLQTFAFAGREWGMEVTPNKAYLDRNYPLAHWVLLPGGFLVTVLLSAYFYNDLSKRARLQKANRDLNVEIVERTRAEEALLNSETKYRVVADNTYDWEFLKDPKGNFLYSSPSCSRITGHESDEFIRDPSLLLQIVHPDDAGAFREHIEDVVEQPHHGEISFRIVCPDGSIRWIEHFCQPVFDANGIYFGTRGSNRDITDRKNAEEERERLIVELQAAMHSVKTLEGILPICASCKQIRDDKGYWTQVEAYISNHTGAEFSHGICPECMKKLYPDYADR
jgi:PAS domain S-box-containing protein